MRTMEVLGLLIAGMIVVAIVVGVVGTYVPPRWVRRLPADRQLRWTGDTWVPAELDHDGSRIPTLR